MLIRSRSARFAALALAVTTPLVASFAAPAFADGNDADVTATINDDGDVVVTSSKGLSRTTVVLCDGSLVVIPTWSGDPMSGVVDVDGVVRAVFVHSGNNTTDEAIALLELLSPGASKGESTGEIAFDEACEETEEPPGGNEEPPGGNEEPPGGDEEPPGRDEEPPGGKDELAADDVEAGSDTQSDPDKTIVFGETLEQPTTPAPATSPVVDSNTLSAGGQLPRTGAGVQFLVTLALALLAAGVTLRATFTRRIRSASSPG